MIRCQHSSHWLSEPHLHGICSWFCFTVSEREGAACKSHEPFSEYMHVQNSCPLKEVFFSESLWEVHHLSSLLDLFNCRKRGELFLRGTYFEEENELVSIPEVEQSTCTSQMGAACPDHRAAKLSPVWENCHIQSSEWVLSVNVHRNYFWSCGISSSLVEEGGAATVCWN